MHIRSTSASKVRRGAILRYQENPTLDECILAVRVGQQKTYITIAYGNGQIQEDAYYNNDKLPVLITKGNKA